MRHEIPVTFESYYYFNLLERIREVGKKVYEQEAFEFLEKFLAYLSTDDEAMDSIEKLVKFQSTSDLSIFFSDILEHLYRIKPDEAISKTDDYAQDFLEIFELLLDDAEWKTFLEKEVGATFTARREVAGEAIQELSFLDYCKQQILETISQHARALSEEYQNSFLQFLHAVIEQPSRMESFRQAIQHPKADEFIALHSALIDGGRAEGDVDHYIRNLNQRVEKWMLLFEGILYDYPEAIASLIGEELGEAATVESGEKISPVEETPQSLPEESVPSEGEIIETLAEKAQELAKIKAKDETVLQEERERRKLLQDYILNEVRDCREELIGFVNTLLSNPGEKSSQKQLLDYLKDLKDLGQIHSYAGLELTAENLTKLFTRAFREQLPIPEECIGQINTHFDLIDEYIRASIVEDDPRFVSRLSENLTNFSLMFRKAEPFTLEEDDILKDTFQEIITRKGDVLKKIMAGKLPAELTDSDYETMHNAVENIAFWSEILHLNSAQKVMEQLKELLSLQNRPLLAEDNWEAIKDSMGLLGENFINRSGDEWEHVSGQLEGALNSLEEVEVFRARPAYEDVIVHLIARFERELQREDVNMGSDIFEKMPAFFKQIELNSLLIKDVNVARACQKASIRVRQLDKDRIEPTPELREELLGLFQNIRSNLSALTEPLNKFSQYFFELNLRFTAETPETTPEPGPEEVSESEKEQAGDTVTEGEEPAEGMDIFTGELPGEAAASEEEPGEIPPDSEVEPEVLSDLEKEIPETIVGSEEGEIPVETTAPSGGESKEAPPVVEEQPAETIPGTEEKQPTEPVSADDVIHDEELQSAFGQEAIAYMDTLEEQLQKLRRNSDDKELWKEFGITVHTLKGSAQMLERTEIAELVIPLDTVVKQIQAGKVAVNNENLDLLKHVLDTLRQRLNEPGCDISEVLTSLTELSYTPVRETEEQKAQEEIPEKETPEEAAVDYIRIAEQDLEMLQIFKDEVGNNFETIEKNLHNIEKYEYDPALFGEIERATHEICSAAKMLGLVEIGQLSEKAESLCSTIIEQNYDDPKTVVPVLRRSGETLKELTLQGEIERTVFENVSREIEDVLQEIHLQIPAAAIEEKGREKIKKSIGETATIQIHELFLQEAGEGLEEINNILLELEKKPGSVELRQDLLRNLHTLKGSAAMVYATKMETLAHLSEEILDGFDKEGRPLDTEIFDLLFEVADEMTHLLESLKTAQEEDAKNFDQILNKLYKFIEPSAEIQPEEIESPMEEESPAAPPEELLPADVVQEQTGIKKSTDAFIRLNIEQMNKLMNLAAELVISHNQLKNQLEQLKEYTPALDTDLKTFREAREKLNEFIQEEKKIRDSIEPLNEIQPEVKESLKIQLEGINNILSSFQELQEQLSAVTHSLKDSSDSYDENIQKLNKLSNEILDEIIQARLVPVKLLFQRFQRPIRDLARQFDKKVNFVFTGEDTELDRTLVEELYNPLLHIIRNAIDHGLETPGERKQAGKNEEGLLEIKASRDRNLVNIEVHDDGRGIDPEAIKKSALQKNLLPEEELEKMREEDILELLFYPGFSTREDTTTISGRGVGLDAVKTQIEKIKGNIRIYSDKQNGTTFSIRIPISLSVIQSMLVEVAGHIYSIPLTQVDETLSISDKDFSTDDTGHHLIYRGKQIPLIILGDLLRIPNERPPRFSLTGDTQAIIIMEQGNRVALAVDKIVRREEILIKSLGPLLKKLKFIVGGSIMADGQVVLVLDVHQIMLEGLKSVPTLPPAQEIPDTIQKMELKKTSPGAQREKKIVKDRRPNILIVDDSLSIRKYLSGILSEKGYLTDTSRNGAEALEMLKSKEFDIMITDLEMPQVSGYELIESVRQEEQFDTLPIIVLTGRAGENFKNLTAELGADSYIIKPFKDRELFEEIDKFVSYDRV